MTQLEHTRYHPRGFAAMAWGIVLAAALVTGFAVGSALSSPFDVAPGAGSEASGATQSMPDRDGRWGPQPR